ncbi:MAG TPA: sulfotransferase [Rhizomicrobium sp.]|jgi:tetratricopeptide (TPR) repeat protein|nr:sulfotransferase [Rhizomicrobium sp.]
MRLDSHDGRPRRAQSPVHLYEVGLTAAAMSYHTAAIEALRECTALAPNHAPAWRNLAQLLRLAKKDAEADAADAVAQAHAGVKWKKGLDERTLAQLQRGERKLLEPLGNKLAEDAAVTLREHLVANPLDAVAMRWLARLEARNGDVITQRALLRRALDICPSYAAAAEDYAELLVDSREHAAIEETKQLIARSSGQPRYRFLHAHALMDAGKVEAATEILTGLLRESPNNVQYWLLYGNALRMIGRREEAIQAYRKCLQVQPDMGEAWWGLAELKDKVLTRDDVAEIWAQLDEQALASESRMAMFYALGQTLERAGEYAASFAAYEEGAREFSAIEAKNPGNAETPDDSALRIRRIRAVFSRENFASKLLQAPPVSPDTPIFVLGMPRAGSTLVEQILASHSQVEGIGERSLIGDIKRGLALGRMLVTQNAYPDCVLDLTPDQLAALGGRVIEDSRNYRTTGRAFFVDKRPWNWLDIGLIHLILPQAKFIDIRREPMAACFAMYKQLLPRKGCYFSYDLGEAGRYYKRYVNLMDHWQTAMPGRVHFLQYERLVEDTEGEIRRMLDYCGLPFEEGCLRFWEVDRAIVTPSAEQVRRPIYRSALEQWRNFEPWLGRLKEALAETVET